LHMWVIHSITLLFPLKIRVKPACQVFAQN
jgi:hypothetical protein